MWHLVWELSTSRDVLITWENKHFIFENINFHDEMGYFSGQALIMSLWYPWHVTFHLMLFSPDRVNFLKYVNFKGLWSLIIDITIVCPIILVYFLVLVFLPHFVDVVFPFYGFSSLLYLLENFACKFLNNFQPSLASCLHHIRLLTGGSMNSPMLRPTPCTVSVWSSWLCLCRHRMWGRRYWMSRSLR